MQWTVFPTHQVQRVHKLECSVRTEAGFGIRNRRYWRVSSGELSKGDVEPAGAVRKSVAISIAETGFGIRPIRRRSRKNLSQAGYPVAGARALDQDRLRA